MKKKFFIFIFALAALWLFSPARIFIQADLLEPLPSIGPSPGYEGGDMANYFQWVFTLGISLAGIFAVLMIVIGGIQYVAAYGNPAQIENAKNLIKQALLGLLLAIGAWLLLYTINPDFIKGGFNIPSINTESKPAELKGYGATGSY